MEYKKLNVEFKNLDSSTGVFEGFASTHDVDLGNDRVEKGAFKKTLIKGFKNIQMLWQHDSAEVIGEWTDAKETDEGLFVKGQLFHENIQRAKEAVFLMAKNKINSMSIGYMLKDHKYDNGVRVLKEVDLHEISLVTWPMNTNALITGLKDDNGGVSDHKHKNEREFESHLRDLGYSKKEALIISSKGFKSFVRDSQEDEDSELIKYLKENN